MYLICFVVENTSTNSMTKHYSTLFQNLCWLERLWGGKTVDCGLDRDDTFINDLFFKN